MRCALPASFAPFAAPDFQTHLRTAPVGGCGTINDTRPAITDSGRSGLIKFNHCRRVMVSARQWLINVCRRSPPTDDGRRPTCPAPPPTPQGHTPRGYRPGEDAITERRNARRNVRRFGGRVSGFGADSARGFGGRDSIVWRWPLVARRCSEMVAILDRWD